jgi:hypothetical protein
MASMQELLLTQIEATEAALADTKARLAEFVAVNPLSGAPLSKEMGRFLDALVARTKKLTGQFKPEMYGTATVKAKPAAK